MSRRVWVVLMSLCLTVSWTAGCGSSTQPRGTAPPAPSPEERAKLKSDPSQKEGQPVSTAKAKRKR